MKIFFEATFLIALLISSTVVDVDSLVVSLEDDPSLVELSSEVEISLVVGVVVLSEDETSFEHPHNVKQAINNGTNFFFIVVLRHFRVAEIISGFQHRSAAKKSENLLPARTMI